MVEEGVGVEAGDEVGGNRCQEGGHGGGGTEPGVDPTLEGHDEEGLAKAGLVLEGVQLVHQRLVATALWAISARRTTWSAKASTPWRSLPMAPATYRA